MLKALKRRQTTLALVTICLVAALAVVRWSRHLSASTSFEQKPLETWLQEFDRWDGKTTLPVHRALQHAGTDALPVLERFIRVDEESLSYRILRALAKMKLHGPITAPKILHKRAFDAYYSLGETALPAVPRLTALLEERRTRPQALSALHALLAGCQQATNFVCPEAKKRTSPRQLILPEKTVNALVSLVRNPDPEVRNAALRCARQAAADRDALQTMSRLQLDSDPQLRQFFIHICSSPSAPRDAAVLYFSRALTDSVPEIRLQAAYRLGVAEHAATNALPALRDRAGNDPEPKVRVAAENAIDKILNKQN